MVRSLFILKYHKTNLFFLGPAKVYAMRGKYKQYFLRISEDGHEKSDPVKLLIEKFTIQIGIDPVSRCHPKISTHSFNVYF
jgi:hypothetical protein